MNHIYNEWLERSLYKEELQEIIVEAEVVDRFYQIVPFGTGGMRGLLGAGTNRMNIHTIRLVAEGLARQIEAQGDMAKVRGVVIAYDTRHYSQEFAYETAGVLAAHGIQSYVFRESRPTPQLSFAVRYLSAIAGVVITASHNPKQYNGFKVYGEDGAQLTPEFADDIVDYMNEVEDIFLIRSLPKEQLLKSGFCTEILEKLDDAYAQALTSLQMHNNLQKDIAIVYTPLHGAGVVPTLRGFQDWGFSNVHVVKEQAMQNGDFPTVTYPNPEEKAAFEMAIALGNELDADILLATDPDADRLGVAVRHNNHYKLLTGNQLGALLLHYILNGRYEKGTLPTNAAIVKTIVTSELGTAIANKFNVETINTLTGFKFIAEKIAEWEQTKQYEFLFGYEESYGYLAGDFVRDKDAVQIALLTAEMAAYYKNQGVTLLNVLNGLYEELGYYKEALISLTFEGLEGQQKIASIMKSFRHNPIQQLAQLNVLKVEDYSVGNINGLPKANVIKLLLEDGSWVCIRPSGTEPKCKLYFGVCCTNEYESDMHLTTLKSAVQELLTDQVKQ